MRADYGPGGGWYVYNKDVKPYSVDPFYPIEDECDMQKGPHMHVVYGYTWQPTTPGDHFAPMPPGLPSAPPASGVNGFPFPPRSLPRILPLRDCLLRFPTSSLARPLPPSSSKLASAEHPSLPSSPPPPVPTSPPPPPSPRSPPSAPPSPPEPPLSPPPPPTPTAASSSGRSTAPSCSGQLMSSRASTRPAESPTSKTWETGSREFTAQQIHDFAFSRFCNTYKSQELCSKNWYQNGFVGGGWHDPIQTVQGEDYYDLTLSYSTYPSHCADGATGVTGCVDVSLKSTYKKCIWSVDAGQCYGAKAYLRDQSDTLGTGLDPNLQDPSQHPGLPSDYLSSAGTRSTTTSTS